MVAALVVLAAALLAGSARAAGWVATPAVRPALPTGELLAVSCPSTAFCAGVGDDANGVLAMNWTGGAWTLVPAPWSGGRPASHLGIVCTGNQCAATKSPIALSCASPAFCVALTLGQGAVAPAVWDGRSWSTGAVPAPIAEPGETLTAVTCRARTLCVVVGWMRRRSGRTVELAERWNGSRWRVQRLPTVPGVRAAGLWGVSCTGPRWCVTVGIAVPGKSTTRDPWPDRGFADDWNGHAWTSDSLGRQPAGSGLFDVSCSSPQSCLAVGFGGAGHTRPERGPLTERFNGRRWRILAGAAVVDTGGEGVSTLTAVSCPAASTCVAVGSFEWANGGDGYYNGSLEERWDGVRWRDDMVGGGGDDGLVLNSDSCARPDACTVVGTDIGTGGCFTPACGPVATFASGWNGRIWSTQATPGAGTPSSVTLTSGSCSGATACVVVGTMSEANGELTATSEAWNGTIWSVQPLPGLISPVIGCDGTGRCLLMAVGSGSRTVLLQWDGSRWGTLAASPPPTLGGTVTCDLGDPCLAVGLTAGGDTETGAFWDGTTWTPTALAAPASTHASAASCAPATATCAVVGGGGGNGYGPSPWTDVWTAGGWASQLMNGPGELTAVSCPTSNFCLATGWTYSEPTPGQNQVQIPIAEAWNGSVWATAPTPDVIPAAVACLSATSCQAVAAASGNVDAYNGQSWTERLAAPNTKSLTGISCHPDGSCVAVGALTDGTPVMERNS